MISATALTALRALLAACGMALLPTLAACANAEPAPGVGVVTPARPKIVASPRPAELDGDEAFHISLHRGPCGGRCPQYTVRIDGEGAVQFEGERFVAARGLQRGVAEPAALVSLLALLRQPEVAAAKDIYRPGQPGCGAIITDMPSSEVAWQLDGRTHRLLLYHGCAALPSVLHDLPQAVDAAAGVGGWVSGGLTH